MWVTVSPRRGIQQFYFSEGQSRFLQTEQGCASLSLDTRRLALDLTASRVDMARTAGRTATSPTSPGNKTDTFPLQITRGSWRTQLAPSRVTTQSFAFFEEARRKDLQFLPLFEGN